MLRRAIIAVIVGVSAGLYCAHGVLLTPSTPAHDLTWPLIGAQQLLAGHNPWVDTTPYRWLNPNPRSAPLYYPLPALLVVTPLSQLPYALAATFFAAVSAALLAYALFTRRPQLCPLLLSYPFVWSVHHAQWAPLTVAAVLLGWWPLLLCKPTLGLPLLVEARPMTRHSWLVLVVSAGLVAASIPFGWLANTRQHESLIPLLAVPIGAVLWLALLQWRTRSAWLFLALCAVPQRGGVDQLALGLVCRTRSEAIRWAVASWGVAGLVRLMRWPSAAETLLLPLAALAVVLMPRLRLRHPEIIDHELVVGLERGAI